MDSTVVLTDDTGHILRVTGKPDMLKPVRVAICPAGRGFVCKERISGSFEKKIKLCNSELA